jgi:hypothetical protein
MPIKNAHNVPSNDDNWAGGPFFSFQNVSSFFKQTSNYFSTRSCLSCDIPIHTPPRHVIISSQFSIPFMFVVWLVLTLSEEDNCSFSEFSSTVNVVGSSGASGRRVLESFGFEVDPTIPTDLSNPLPYVYSIVPYAVAFAVFFVIYLLLPIQMYYCCCCCRPKEGLPRPGIIKLIVHIVGCALIMISALLFFVAASQFTAGLNHISALPSQVNDTLIDVLNFAETGLGDLFSFFESGLNDVSGTMDSLIEWMDNQGNKSEASAERLNDNLLDQYVAHFGENEYTSTWNTLLAASQNHQLQLMIMNGSLSLNVLIAKAVTTQLINAQSEIHGALEDGQQEKNGNMKEAADTINKFRESDGPKAITDVKTMLADFTDMFDSMLDPVEALESTINTAIYSVSSFVLFIGVGYTLVYFFNCCCSRCLVICFPCFGLLLALVIILPGIVFAVLFFPLYDLCPSMESFINSFVPDYFTDPYTAEDVLLCKETLALFDVLDLGLDVNDLLENVQNTIAGQTNFSWDSQGLTQAMQNFADHFSIENNLSSDAFHTNFSAVLHEIGTDDSMKVYAYISAADTSHLVDIRSNFTEVLSFGTQVTPRVDDAIKKVKFLIQDIGKEAMARAGALFNGLTCRPVKCIYSPVKTILCTDVIGGTAFWIISTICLCIGIIWVDISLCCRRRTMTKRKVNAEDEDQEEKERELRDIDQRPFKQRIRKKHRVKKRRVPAVPPDQFVPPPADPYGGYYAGYSGVPTYPAPTGGSDPIYPVPPGGDVPVAEPPDEPNDRPEAQSPDAPGPSRVPEAALPYTDIPPAPQEIALDTDVDRPD